MEFETETGGADVRFSPTAWTVVRRAREGSREAWDVLIASYWKPAYFFVRRRGHDVEAAKDLVQGFFATALEKDFLDGVSADQGRFRTWLLAALSHYLSNQRDRETAKKRGGGIDFVRAEADLPAAGPTPEAAFLSGWAREILARAMARLRRSVSEDDLALLGGAARPDLTPTDRKHRLYRLRGRLRDCLCQEVSPSVDRAEDVESEVRELFRALGKEI
jgi:DNA-directed RNA polymerase specialized sigma24 family protein